MFREPLRDTELVRQARFRLGKAAARYLKAVDVGDDVLVDRTHQILIEAARAHGRAFAAEHHAAYQSLLRSLECGGAEVVGGFARRVCY